MSQDSAAPAAGLARRMLRRPDESGDSLALLVIWPSLIVAILVLLVHAFIVTNAQAEAEVAASAGLRAAWRVAANEDFRSARDASGNYGVDDDGDFVPYDEPTPHPAVLEMAAAAEDAIARAAATEEGWRWWTPSVAAVYSDWCASDTVADRRPREFESGWIRVAVSGEVFGPLAALWPNRLDRVHAAALGPADLLVERTAGNDTSPPPVPAELPAC